MVATDRGSNFLLCHHLLLESSPATNDGVKENYCLYHQKGKCGGWTLGGKMQKLSDVEARCNNHSHFPRTCQDSSLMLLPQRHSWVLVIHHRPAHHFILATDIPPSLSHCPFWHDPHLDLHATPLYPAILRIPPGNTTLLWCQQEGTWPC